VKAYYELYRVICAGASTVIVNGWPKSKMMERWEPVVLGMERLINWAARVKQGFKKTQRTEIYSQPSSNVLPASTFTARIDSESLGRHLKGLTFDIYVWRSVSVRFLRALVHPILSGKFWLRFLFWLEENNPHYYGMVGMYPMIVLKKTHPTLPEQRKI
jgi:hypothetical protein